MVAPLVALIVLLVVAPARAAGPGDLDRSFGGDGRIALAAAGAFVPRAVGVDGEDRIVVGGYLCAPDPETRDGTCLVDGDASFRLVRLTPDGGLDAEFGENGFVTTPVGDGRSEILDMIVYDDGRILAAGVARRGERDVFALARYSAMGALDPSFGAGGIALAPVGAAHASLGTVAAGPRGTVLAAGQAVDDAGTARMAVARFAPDGSLDPGFGSGGVTLAPTATFGYGQGVIAHGDGALVAGLFGTSDAPATYRFGELRVDANGAPDPAFDGDGAADQSVGDASSFANAVTAAPGGWLAAGAAVVGSRQAMAAVLGTADGALVGEYGRKGRVLVVLEQGAVANDVLMERGRALLVGQAATASGGYAFATVRLDRRGRRDSEFSGDGAAIVRWPDYPIARATAGALQRGRLVSVGVGCVGGADARCSGGTARLLLTRQLAGTDRRAPVMRTSRVPRRMPPARLRGMRVRVTLSEPARLRARLLGGGRRLWTEARRSPADAFTVRVHARRAALARLRGRRLKLALRATDLAGNAVTRRLTFRLSR